MNNGYFSLMSLFCLLAICAIPCLPDSVKSAQTQQMLEPHVQAMPLAPFLDYLVDETMMMDVEEAARAPGWRPLGSSRLPMEEGALWLRFTIAPISPDAKPQTFLLDMGQSVPGQPTLYEPLTNELSGRQEWRENLPAQRNIILLPEASTTAQPCYIRLDGLPGPWFAPMIRTPHNAATNWSSLAMPAAILSLAVVAILCVLRGLGETGQWRYWTGLFVCAALAQAIIGMPQAMEQYTAKDLASILLPGVSLMFLPHVGRHLMDTRHNSKSLDIQLFLLSFVGAALAIMPLIPGWNWLDRWLALWPAGAVLFIPTALGAWMGGLRGSRRFLLACLILPVFTGVALLGLEFGVPANILASLPQWGVALGALILAAAVMQAGASEPKTEPGEDVPPALPPFSPMKLETDPILNLEHPLDDPNLKLIVPDALGAVIDDAPPARRTTLEKDPPATRELEYGRIAEDRENTLRLPVDEIMREASALTNFALPPSARNSVEKLLAASELLANIISRHGIGPDPESVPHGNEAFNLERVLRNAHDSVASVAEFSGIMLSWYMPPHLGPVFMGDAKTLERILSLLLESAARASRKGAIKLSARRVPDSADHGHILFTVEDDGQGYPPRERSSLALVKAWELAGESDGYLSVECSAQGATISFSMHLTPVEEEKVETAARPCLALAASDQEARRNLLRILETAECRTREGNTPGEIIAAQTAHPCMLLIAQGDFARPAAADMVREFVRLARHSGIARPYVLAITPDQSQWALLKASGFTHAMLEPVDPEVLRRTVNSLQGDREEAGERNAGKEPAVREEPLFDERGSELAAGDGEEATSRRSNAAEAPTMLIEQNFSLPAAFEGPAWLAKAEEEDFNDDMEQPGNAGATRTPAPRDERPRMSAPVSANGGDAVAERSYSDRTEWVGEPMPLGSPISEAAAKGMERQRQAENIPQPAKNASPGEESGSPEPGAIDKSDDKDQSLLDFIVSPDTGAVKAAPVEASAVAGENEAGNTGVDNSTVRNFVASSVNLVAETLSSMLRHGSGEGRPEHAPEAPSSPSPQAQTDPEILSLIARLDEAMAQAATAWQGENMPAVAAAVGIIAKDANEFGLRSLVRLASGIERAARTQQRNAVQDLLPDLKAAIECNRETLFKKKYGSGLGNDAL